MKNLTTDAKDTTENISTNNTAPFINSEGAVITKRQNYDVLDLAKFILSIFIVAIHSVFFPEVLYPWLRIAVPLFFIITSFLFFTKIKDLDKNEQNKALWKFVKRNLILYLVWFIILLPITIIIRKSWFNGDFLQVLWTIVRQIFLGSTFSASWYITASIISVVIVFYLSRKINLYVILGGSFIIFLFCCLVSGYANAFSFVGQIDKTIRPYLGDLNLSFWIGLIWISVGKLFADKKIRLNYVVCITAILVSAVLLYLEYYFTTTYLPTPKNRDGYVFLLPLCCFIFAGLLKFTDKKIKFAVEMRKCSTLIYVSHGAFILGVQTVLGLLHINILPLVFVISLPLTLAFSILIVWLAKKPKLKFLKYLY